MDAELVAGLRRAFGVSSPDLHDLVFEQARRALAVLGHAGCEPVSWRWGVLTLSVPADRAAGVSLDADRLRARVEEGLAEAGSPGLVSRVRVLVGG